MKAGSLKHLALALALVCLVAQRPMGLALRLLLPGVDSDPVSFYAAVLLQELLLWLLPALAMRPWRVRRLGPRESVAALAWLALPLGALVQLGMSALTLLFQPGAESMPLPGTSLGWMLCVLAVVIAPVVCEEAFFRGGVLTHLMEVCPPPVALILSTGIFALMHASLTGLPSQLAVSACCTLLMMSTGRCYLPMLAHLGYNAMALLALFLPRSPLYALCLLAPVAACVPVVRAMRWQREADAPAMSRFDRALAALLLMGETARYFL